MRELEPGDLRRDRAAPRSAAIPSTVRRVEHELVRVGPAVGAHRGRLAPDQPAPAARRSGPTGAARGRSARRSSVPSQPSIGQDGEAVGGGERARRAPSVNVTGVASGPPGSTASATGTSASIPSSSRRARSAVDRAGASSPAGSARSRARRLERVEALGEGPEHVAVGVRAARARRAGSRRSRPSRAARSTSRRRAGTPAPGRGT